MENRNNRPMAAGAPAVMSDESKCNMKIQCNCCKERPIIELPDPRNHKELVFCKCGKLLASPKEFRGVESWFIHDVFFDTEFGFSPVKIII